MLFLNKYLNPSIEKEIKNKGFCIYNYISLSELFMGVQRDFLEILSKINMPFAILTIVGGITSAMISEYTVLMVFLLAVYAIIFIILGVKLLKRSMHYIHVSNVVYTKRGIILGESLYAYNETEKIQNELIKYEEIFDEFLGKTSNIKTIILQKRFKILKESTNIKDGFVDLLGKLGGERNLIWSFVVVTGTHIVYVGMLYVFYYVGYIFGGIIFVIISQFIKIGLYIKGNIEIKMKKGIEEIDESFGRITHIGKILSTKIRTFSEGEISNIAPFVEKNFIAFYGEILVTLQQRKELLKIIEKSQYKDFIDFVILEKYIKRHFNSPIKEMIDLLENFEGMLSKGLKSVKIIISNEGGFSAHLTKKEKSMELQLESLRENKKKLERVML